MRVPGHGASRSGPTCPEGGLSALRPTLEINLRSVYRNVRGCLDTEAHLCAIARQDHDLDVVADHDALFVLPRQNEHEPQFPDLIQLSRTSSLRAYASVRPRRIDFPLRCHLFTSLAPE